MNPSESWFGSPTSIFNQSSRNNEDSERLNTSRDHPRMESDGDGDSAREETAGKKGSKEMTSLHEDFKPGEFDVICGRGRSIWNSAGNRHFRQVVESRVDEYSAAKTKLDKSSILSSIVADIRRLSPSGGFIRKDSKSGQWFEVGDFLAREKVSQSFRDALHDRYRSSNKTKRKRRIEEQAKTAEISSEMQRVALEQIQSGQTDKNLYEIICQQQSLLEHSQRRPSATREDRADIELAARPDHQLSDRNLAVSLADFANSKPPAILSPYEVGISQGFQSVAVGGDPNTSPQSQTSLLPQNVAGGLPYSLMHSAGILHSQQPVIASTLMHDNSGQLPRQVRLTNLSTNSSNRQAAASQSGYTGDSPPSEFAQKLAAAIRQSAEGGHRDDDPFEPVPLPEDDLTGDIDRIFD